LVLGLAQPIGRWSHDDNGYHGGWNQSYAERNGLRVLTSTWFKGEDRRRHICQ
jgi:hypothetical protein